MKKCYICLEDKNESEFYRDRTAKDGREFCCKSCKSQRQKEYRKNNPEKSKESQRKSLEKNFESIRESQRLHVEKNREKICARRREHYANNREEITKKENERRKTPEFREYARNYQKLHRQEKSDLTSAWQKVSRAIRNGCLEKVMKCEICRSGIKVEAHHDDYSKPLDVRWLCSLHHHRHHAAERAAKI